MIRNIHNEIKNEYDRKQKAAFDTVQSRKAEVYQKVPRIEDIDNAIQLTGIKYNKMILFGKTDADDAVRYLLHDIRLLKKEKAELLSLNGYPADYFEAVFECPHCSDTGFIPGGAGSEKCSCYRQKLIEKLYSQANLKLAQTENFSSFSEAFYPESVDEARYGIKVSPRENILSIKEKCMNFIENFMSSEEKNMFFYGPAGVGKTFMSNCIALELISKGFTVLYQTSPILFNTLQEYRLKSFKDDDFEDLAYSGIFDADLLIIDDLGTESPTAARYAELLNILNTRQNNNMSRPCKTIISSNLGIKNLYDYYTERVASRIVGNFDIFRFAGEDIRTLKKLTAAR